MSRKSFLTLVVATTCGLVGFFLVRNDNLRDQVVERSKSVAAALRSVPRLGYRGRSTQLADEVGSRTLLKAENDEPGYWKGAPSVAYNEANDQILTHVRHRNPSERGHTVSIYRIIRDDFTLENVVNVHKRELDARSIEGGELVVDDGKITWYISYQSQDAGDWRVERRCASTLKRLRLRGDDLALQSDYFHQKDPSLIDGELYVVSSSRYWTQSTVEKTTPGSSRLETTNVPVDGVGNARITSGGVLGNEVFADIWPNFPCSGVQNVLWNTDERSSTGSLGSDSVYIDPSRHFVSASGGSVTYVDATLVDGVVYLLWQEQRPDRSNDLVGTTLGIEEYKELVNC